MFLFIYHLYTYSYIHSTGPLYQGIRCTLVKEIFFFYLNFLLQNNLYVYNTSILFVNVCCVYKFIRYEHYKWWVAIEFYDKWELNVPPTRQQHWKRIISDSDRRTYPVFICIHILLLFSTYEYRFENVYMQKIKIPKHKNDNNHFCSVLWSFSTWCLMLLCYTAAARISYWNKMILHWDEIVWMWTSCSFW